MMTAKKNRQKICSIDLLSIVCYNEKTIMGNNGVLEGERYAG